MEKRRQGGDHARVTEPERKPWSLHSPHLQPQCRRHQEWGGGPPGHGWAWTWPAGGRRQGLMARGASEERQRAKVLEEGRAWGPEIQKPLLSVKDGPWGRIPPHPCTGHCSSHREPPAGNSSLAFPSYLRPAQNPGSLLPAQPPLPSRPSPPGSPRFNVPSSVKTPPGTCPAFF